MPRLQNQFIFIDPNVPKIQKESNFFYENKTVLDFVNNCSNFCFFLVFTKMDCFRLGGGLFVFGNSVGLATLSFGQFVWRQQKWGYSRALLQAAAPPPRAGAINTCGGAGSPQFDGLWLIQDHLNQALFQILRILGWLANNTRKYCSLEEATNSIIYVS